MVRFQLLESTLVFAVGRFMHPGGGSVPPQLTMSVLYEIPFASLVKVFSSIPVVLAGPEPPFSRLEEDTDETRQLVADFASAAKLCTAAEEKRNQLMHSSWFANIAPHDGSVLRVKMRTTKKGARSAMVRESVETVTAAIAAIDAASLATFTASATLNFSLFPIDEDAA